MITLGIDKCTGYLAVVSWDSRGGVRVKPPPNVEQRLEDGRTPLSPKS